MLHLQLCSARYTAIRMKDSMRSVSAITTISVIATITATGKPYRATVNQHLALSAMELGHKGGQR